jgi:hypothetical protein
MIYTLQSRHENNVPATGYLIVVLFCELESYMHELIAEKVRTTEVAIRYQPYTT